MRVPSVVAAVALSLMVIGCDDDPNEPDPVETFKSTMNGAGENPPLTNTATATATYRLVNSTTMEYSVTATGLTGTDGSTNAFTGLHVHGPRLDATGNGSVAVNLCPAEKACSVPTTGANAGKLMSGETPVAGVSGTFTGANVRADMGDTEQARFDSLLVLMRASNGLAYTNLHTNLNPGGQARGPVVKQ